MHFERFDICAAWNLYLQHNHGGQFSPEHKRLCRLQSVYKPSHSEEYVHGLSQNALEIYAKLVGETRPLLDAGDHCRNFYALAFGAYGDTRLLVRAESLEDALEMAVEWIDDNAPGLLHTIGEAEYIEAAAELGYDPNTENEAEQAEIQERAEQDMYVVGHTTLKNGNAIPSWEWFADECDGPEAPRD
jgi:hypothetical protein